ncbi:MAG: DNA polymerase I [Pseudomonadales bacterium]|nr:DNA polymerase I [Pseudomonadales bacterium]
MTETNTPLILVDGSSYLYRAFHALPTLTTSSGQHTGAVRGVISMIRRLHKDYPASPLAIIFDAKGKTFRHELFPAYKANRPPMPMELREQIEPIHQLVKAMGLPLLAIEGVEADDVIGTLAHEATRKGIEVIISTGDKDMAQLVSEHVTLINTMTNTRFDREGVIEKFGVAPEQIIDYLALMGDKVDNIPGVDKCGPKTAVKWLNEYSSLDKLIENSHEVKGKIGENLRNSIEFLPLSRELATIKTDLDLPISLQDIKMAEPDNQRLISLYQSLEFKSWLDDLLSPAQSDASPSDSAESKNSHNVINTAHYETLLDQPAFNRWLEKLRAARLFAFDTETTSLDYMSANIVGISVAIEPGQAAYIPFGHDYLDAPRQLDRAFVLDSLKPLLEDPEKAKLGQNLKYDIHVLANEGITFKGAAFDTMLESYVLNSTGSRHDMDTLSLKYLGHRTIGFTDIAGKGSKQLTFNQIALEQASPYAAEDADITLRLHQQLWPLIEKEAGLKRLLLEEEIPLIEILARIERNGALVSANLLGEQSKELSDRLNALEKQAYDLAGEAFNINSPKQLLEILFNKLGLPVIKKTPKGQPSTAEPVLQELALDYPLPKLILEYRSLSKLKSTYTDKLPQMIHPGTGRIHTSYHQAVTATGRLSSSDPNLQNIPIRTEEGRRIRQAFIARPGYKIVAADYSQIELRIMAHLSQDHGLLKAFELGHDIHKATASEVFNVGLLDVSAEQRRSAKAINFGLIYGMSAFGLAKQLGISRHDAQAYIDRYFQQYPGVQHYMDDIRNKAADQGFVETLFGRRLYLPDIRASNRMLREAAERTAINAPMQGTAADIIKRAMIRVDNWLNTDSADAMMIMQVHDELVFEVAEQQIDKIVPEIIRLMSSAAELHVPLVVEAGVGNNWDEAH